MRFQAAVVKEQGITFAVVVVKKSVVDSEHQSRETILGFQSAFPGIPIVLMGQDSRGRAFYRGQRQDIVNFLSNVPVQAIPWRWYDYN